MTQINSLCRVVVLISGSGTNLQALIDYQNQHQMALELVGVISNRPDVAGLERAAQAGIHTVTLDHTQFDDRQSFDAAMQKHIESFSPDLVVLAGYMRIMTPKLVNAFSGKMLNIHPSLLPKYPGLKTHQKVLNNGDKKHGSSVHFVTEELDAGPVIAQTIIDVSSDDTEQTLIERIKTKEHELYPKVVQWFAEGRLSFHDNQTYYNQAILEQPIQI